MIYMHRFCSKDCCPLLGGLSWETLSSFPPKSYICVTFGQEMSNSENEITSSHLSLYIVAVVSL